jgi:acyl-CoA synthetase (AMP-forming)/AMP-acid ligase II
MTPIDTLYRRARSHPDSVAFIAGDDTWSYRRLAAEVERLVRAFAGREMRAGDRVALHMANLPELVIAYYACFRIGAIACPLNIRLKTAELQPLLYQLRPALYLGQAELYSQIAAAQPDILAANARFIVGGASEESTAKPWDDLFIDVTDRSAMRDPDADIPAVLLTTSGTTGNPKFVAHTSTTLSAIADSFLHLGLDEEQIAVNAVPMMHVGDLQHSWVAFASAGPWFCSSVLMPMRCWTR